MSQRVVLPGWDFLQSLGIWGEIQLYLSQRPRFSLQREPDYSLLGFKALFKHLYWLGILIYYLAPEARIQLLPVDYQQHKGMSFSVAQYPLGQCLMPRRCTKSNCQMNERIYLTHSWNHRIENWSWLTPWEYASSGFLCPKLPPVQRIVHVLTWWWSVILIYTQNPVHFCCGVFHGSPLMRQLEEIQENLCQWESQLKLTWK